MFFFFVVDTSASMNQRLSARMSFLDVAKAGIEHFVNVRRRDPLWRFDHFALVTLSPKVESALRARVGPLLSIPNLQSDITGRGPQPTSLFPALQLWSDNIEDFLLQ